MALNITPKAKGNNAVNAPVTQPQGRPQVNYQPKPSSARAEALKERLIGKPSPQPVAPRKAGSSARAEEYAKLQKYPTPSAPAPQAPPIGNSTARRQAPTEAYPEQPSGMSAQRQASPESESHEELSQVDTSVETEKAPEATSKPLSPQFVALAKQEAAIRRSRQELKAAQDAFKAEQASFVKMDELKSDPLKVLAEAGINYDRLVELQLNQEAPDPNQVLLDKIAELEARVAGVGEEFTKRDSQQYESAIGQIRSDVKLLVDSDPTFETIKATDEMGDKANGSEAVVELIKRVFDKEGTILPVEEAAKLIEQKLEDRVYQISQKFTSLAKIKSRMAPPAEPEEAIQEQPLPQSKITTLTNNGAAQRPLTARERAIQRIKDLQSGK